MPAGSGLPRPIIGSDNGLEVILSLVGCCSRIGVAMDVEKDSRSSEGGGAR